MVAAGICKKVVRVGIEERAFGVEAPQTARDAVFQSIPSLTICFFEEKKKRLKNDSIKRELLFDSILLSLCYSFLNYALTITAYSLLTLHGCPHRSSGLISRHIQLHALKTP